MLVSDDVIDTVNMHFVVHEGVTLTFKAPAVKVARDEVKRHHRTVDINHLPLMPFNFFRHATPTRVQYKQKMYCGTDTIHGLPL